MLQDGDIITIRQFCLDRAIAIFRTTESVTLVRHLEAAGEIEDWLMQQEDAKKPRLGRNK